MSATAVAISKRRSGSSCYHAVSTPSAPGQQQSGTSQTNSSNTAIASGSKSYPEINPSMLLDEDFYKLPTRRVRCHLASDSEEQTAESSSNTTPSQQTNSSLFSVSHVSFRELRRLGPSYVPPLDPTAKHCIRIDPVKSAGSNPRPCPSMATLHNDSGSIKLVTQSFYHGLTTSIHLLCRFVVGAL
ncbi:uncharacterized protein UDID_18437 [Ustilago sp. UG-2017a]|nr:uncharacterized protein UDID_18437 [Ustilago sp. UG-2017a]